jgi:hypothetical protein
MNKDPSRVKGEALLAVDQWVLDQIGKKNLLLEDERSGIHVVDRGPLDAFAFTKKGKWRKKAQAIRGAVSKGKAIDRTLCKAHVIFLTGDPDVMAARSILRHKDFNPKELTEQQELLREVYAKRLGNGVSTVDTTDKGIPQVVKEVARVVLLQPYEEADLDGCLNGLIGSKASGH